MLKKKKFMRGAVLWKTGEPLSVEDYIEIPDLKDGQVLVKISYSGVCRSQLMEVRGLRGEDKYLPHLSGHEGCGEVIEVGNSVTKVRVGDSVILGWIKSSGKDVKGAIYECNGVKVNSGPVTTFSNYSIVSENRVVRLPQGIPKDIAVLFGCALPTGAGLVLNEISPKKGSSIAIIGLGGIGLSALMATKVLNCDPVIAIDISEEKLEMAVLFGASHTINSSNEDVIQRVFEITNGLGVDFSIEAAGQAKTIETAFKIIKDKGECVFASHPAKGEIIRLDPHELISGKTIKGSWGGGVKPDSDIPKLAKIYLEGKLPLEHLISKVYSLDEINQALEDLENYKVFRPIISFIN
jgi:S-(hydroxymethyl)glutathione dehydrogenase / alcohol dehydrogenase